MKWSELPESVEADASLRRAAAESVMKWKACQGSQYQGSKDGWAEDLPPGMVGRFYSSDGWLRRWGRDDLAQVFREAMRREQIYSSPTMNNHLLSLWSLAIHNPRASLAALLDLLEINP